jgi:hypothetical protein
MEGCMGLGNQVFGLIFIGAYGAAWACLGPKMVLGALCLRKIPKLFIFAKLNLPFATIISKISLKR